MWGFENPFKSNTPAETSKKKTATMAAAGIAAALSVGAANAENPAHTPASVDGRYPVSLTLFPCVPTIRTYEKIV
jgi:hypothetical protein